jgi:hypothetical protein
MRHVYYPNVLERRPYIPAGCDQQRRLHDGARAELPHRVGLGSVPVVALFGGTLLWAQVFIWLWLWF